jgi:hypothetical protein
MKKAILLLLLCVSCNQAKEKSIPIKSPKLLTPIFLGFTPLMDNSEFVSQLKIENKKGNLDNGIFKLSLNNRSIDFEFSKEQNSLKLILYNNTETFHEGENYIKENKKIINYIISIYSKKYNKPNDAYKNELKNFMSELYGYRKDYTFDDDYKVFRDSLRTVMIHYSLIQSDGYISKETGFEAYDESDPKNVKVKHSSLNLYIKYFHNSYLKNFLVKQNLKKQDLKKIDSINKENIKKQKERLLKNNNNI